MGTTPSGSVASSASERKLQSVRLLQFPSIGHTRLNCGQAYGRYARYITAVISPPAPCPWASKLPYRAIWSFNARIARLSYSDSLRSGKTKSCGCGRAALKHDLTNQTFGFLQVIEPVKNERIKGNEIRWKCVCQNCGRTVEVSSYWLRHSDPYGHCNCTRFNKPSQKPSERRKF